MGSSLVAMYRYFKKINNTDHILLYRSKGLSGESIKPPVTFYNSLAPSLNYIGTKTRENLKVSVYNEIKLH